jgi:N-acetylmuramoyl-L-alanine amidase
VNSSPTFENSPITRALFTENDGHVDLTITAEVPLMASFSNGGRTITVAAIPPGTPSAANDSLPGTPSSAVRLPAEPEPDKISSSGPPRGASAAPRVLAIVDAAHGGSERGAALSDTVAEKDVTLGFARLLRHELERQGFAVLLLRNGDDTLSLDQRAGSVNFAHPAIYISLHAASEGSGARVYTSLLPLEGSDRGPFRAWDAAQRVALPLSQAAASAIVSEMQKHDFRAHGYVASLRPLNNVLVPAVAIELAPGPNGVSDLPSANYQQKAAAAIADGVATLRDRLGSQP